MSDTYDAYDDLEFTGKPDERILREAKRRFSLCQERESLARTHFENDMKFANGDSYNNYQWPDGIMLDRRDRPTLTVNKVRQHCLQIINDARQNKVQVKVRPVGGGATYKAAEIFEGMIRHIEYISNAQSAYDSASWNQVIGGLGWWRIECDYADYDSNEQEIYIRRVGNPLTVFIDPDIQEYDGSDARYGFVFEDMPRDRFKARYPKYYRDMMRSPPLDSDGGGPIYDRGDGWDDEHHVRLCEYFRRTTQEDRKAGTVRGGEAIKVEWFLLAGGKIVDRKLWPGNFIPLVRIVGEEFEINGQLDRRGHTRALIDAQRMYNYWTSSAVEQVALQSKAPFIGDKAAFENLPQWENAHLKNYPYLAYNGRDEMGQPIERPSREQPPQMAQAYIQGMQIAAEEFRMASGQYESNFGEKSNEKSGRAIELRAHQGDRATQHFVDHLAIGIRYTGKQLLDLIPKIYDTRRVMAILAEDGSERRVMVDPTSPVPHAPVLDPRTGQAQPEPGDDGFDPQQIQAIFNPSVGQYACIADVGPEYATRRQMAFDAMTQIISQNAGLAPIVGDLLFKSADFPLSDEIAERLRRMVPPQALGKAPDQQQQQMMAQLQQAHHAVVALQGQLQAAEAKAQQAQANAAKAGAAAAMTAAKAAGQQAMHLATNGDASIEQYKAETQRLAAVGGIDPDALKPLIRSMVSEMLGFPAVPVIGAHKLHDQHIDAMTAAATEHMKPQPMPTGPTQAEQTAQ